MRTTSIAITLSLCATLLIAVPASAQKRTAKKASSGAETSLVGIHLFDTGSRVVSVYGSPDSIEAVTLGGGAAGPGGGAAGGPGGASLPGRGPGLAIPGKSGAGATGMGPISSSDFSFGDAVLANQAVAGVPVAPGGGQGSRGGPGVPGGGPGGGGPGAAASGTGESVDYTRWVYNRNSSKYAFVMDRFNRVVQIEAIGIPGGKAHTARGVSFGSSFATLIKKYGAPDGYEINGDSIVVRYLSKSKCAFRLNRLGENKPSVVTGIVVAAGKR